MRDMRILLVITAFVVFALLQSSHGLLLKTTSAKMKHNMNKYSCKRSLLMAEETVSDAKKLPKVEGIKHRRYVDIGYKLRYSLKCVELGLSQRTS